MRTKTVVTGSRRRGRAPASTGGAAQAVPSPWKTVRGGAALYRSYELPNAAAAAGFAQLATAVASHTGLPMFVRLQGSLVTLVLRGDGYRRLSRLTGELFDGLASLGSQTPTRYLKEGG